ncbi:hypothetical protein Drose_13135 [Dactylosporangium roseum]|uniref:DUF5666 domain-containing protein n=1 Tax=Dactylosporangium roseum TaxID=47989 RepID=A0ABY5ZEJ2_9ACTN|nr:hypothetical protein [Dactylosporangium roseum]UWZ39078.1 hypothetical protein Drose_13135 [Dactylosporangium roseum]
MSVHPGPPRRSPWLIPAVVVAVLAAAAAGVVIAVRVLGSGDDPAAATCRQPVAPLSVSTQQAGKANLSVSEQGFSPTAGRIVSIGGIVVNNSKQAAYRTRVTFRVVGADGTSLVRPQSAQLLHQEIPVVLPGERVAVGAGVSMDPDAVRSIARVEIELGGTRSVPADPANPLFRPLTVTLAGPTTSTAGASAGSLHFGVTASGCTGLVERGVGIVYRDAGGTIVGGALNAGAAKGRCAGTGGPQTVTVTDVPPTAELSKTRISVYCDVAGVSKDHDGATPPAN